MKHLYSKTIIYTLFFVVFIFTPFITFATPSVNSAPASITQQSAGSNYQPITPGGESFFGGGGFEAMLEKIFQISIYGTVMLAVVMIIFGGLQYMGSESVFQKGAGKDKIYAALAGLLLALISILMLSTILPSGGSGDAFRINIFQTSQ